MDLPARPRPAPGPDDPAVAGPGSTHRAAHAPGHGHPGTGHAPGHSHPTAPHPGTSTATARTTAPGWRAAFELDALVFGDLLDEAVAVAVEHAPDPTRTVLDLGAGTGTGTRALARAFPDAEVVAVDADAAMLDRLRARLAGTGLAECVRTVEADLDAGWPPVGVADVVWASASLHHVADPARVLHDVHDALAPGGLLVVVEMTATSPVLPDGAARRPRRAPRSAPWRTPAGTATRLDPVPDRRRAGGGGPTRADRRRAAGAGHVPLGARHRQAPARAPGGRARARRPRCARRRARGDRSRHDRPTVRARGGRVVWAARRPR